MAGPPDVVRCPAPGRAPAPQGDIFMIANTFIRQSTGGHIKVFVIMGAGRPVRDREKAELQHGRG